VTTALTRDQKLASDPKGSGFGPEDGGNGQRGMIPPPIGCLAHHSLVYNSTPTMPATCCPTTPWLVTLAGAGCRR
jgi:hypothetical protein